MNPPFPHKKTDVPPERFVERALEALTPRGKLAVILPSSLLVKADKSKWRERILSKNTLLAVCQMPDELFQPYASSTTTIALFEKGTPQEKGRKTVFVRLQYDGLTLKKSVRVPRSDGKNELPAALDAVANKKEVPGFSGLHELTGGDEWAPGAYVPSAPPTDDELKASVDVLLRRWASFYVRYAEEIAKQRALVAAGTLKPQPYRTMVGATRLKNAAALSTATETIGGMFDIVYGQKELHSREAIPPGDSLIISPTEEYNGCYGWLEFDALLEPPFITVAQTGTIGEAFMQTEPCGVNDDCLVLLAKDGMPVTTAHLAIAAATIRLERWRFTYGRKLTPNRIASFRLRISAELLAWVTDRVTRLTAIADAAVAGYAK